MIVRDLMQREVLSLREELSIGEACDLFQQAHVQGAPVVDEQARLVGFVSQEDILYGGMGVTEGPRVKDVMTAPPVSASEETLVVDLCRTMWKLRIHHVPIVHEGKVTGMVSTMDLCRAISEGTIRV